MKNLITFVALLISATGVVISLAREEVRCYMGLESANCTSTQKNRTITQPREAAKPAPRVRESQAPEPLPETVAKEKTSPPIPSQPLEVIPAPETNPTSSIPLEVIAAPEQ